MAQCWTPISNETPFLLSVLCAGRGAVPLGLIPKHSVLRGRLVYYLMRPILLFCVHTRYKVWWNRKCTLITWLNCSFSFIPLLCRTGHWLEVYFESFLIHYSFSHWSGDLCSIFTLLKTIGILVTCPHIHISTQSVSGELRCSEYIFTGAIHSKPQSCNLLQRYTMNWPQNLSST